MVKDPAQSLLYAAQNEGGVAVIRTSKSNAEPRLAFRISKNQLGGLDATTVLLREHTLYVALGNFFTARGKFGLAKVDVTNGAQPVVRQVWTSEFAGHGASGLAESGGYLAMGLMSDGLAVFDLSSTKLKLRTTFRLNNNFPHATPREPTVPHARGLTYADGMLYVADDAGGLRVIRNPNSKNPVEDGRYVQEAMLDKPQAFNSVVTDRHTAYVGVDYAGIEIINVTDPSRPKSIAWWNPWKADAPEQTWFSSVGHVNQIAFDANSGTLYAAAGAVQLIALDVSTSSEARLSGQYGNTADKKGTWGLTLDGDKIYLSYVRSLIPFIGNWAGVRCLRVSR